MNFNSVFNVTIRPIKHLTYRTNLGYTYNSTKESYFYGSQSFQVNGGVNRAGRENDSDNRITWNNTLTYDNYFGKHHIVTDAIQEIIKYQTDDTSAEGRSMDVEDMTYYNLGILTENIGIKSSYSGYQLASFMGVFVIVMQINIYLIFLFVVMALRDWRKEINGRLFILQELLGVYQKKNF